MNWERLFATHILERGYDYYLENTVENIDISEDIIRADVIGSEISLSDLEDFSDDLKEAVQYITEKW